jgi:membrane-associated phospholipid phosphatase
MLASFLAGLIAVVIFTMINLYWKISLHTAFMSGSSAILTIVYGIPGAITILLIVILGWSRIQLKLHTLSQVVVGAVLPAIVVLVTFWGFGFVG